MVDFIAIPQRTALVNVDMQNCFVENSPIASPEGPAVLKRINRFIAAARSYGVKIIHTAHWLRPDYSNIGVLDQVIPAVRQHRLIEEGTFPAALHKDLDVKPTDIILSKPRFGAFHGTDLELILRSNGIDSVIVSGIATNVCCETTAREANARDFKVFFLSDGTATFGSQGLTADEVQRAALANVASVFGEVLTIDQMLTKLKTGTSATQAQAAE
jgi:ureidoacrylate peracid hydrolase